MLNKKSLIFIIILLPFFLNGSKAEPSILRQLTMFYGNGTTGPYDLPDKFILVGSDSIYISDTLISKEHYQIDYNRGIIFFTNALPESIKITVQYQRIPFLDLSPRYFQHLPRTETVIEREEKSMSVSDTFSSMPGDLLVSGSKTLGFSVSSGQGLGIEQATRLNLHGELSGVEIEAMLSDQSLPIPPEGVTKEISELDKILINVRKGGLAGSFGDYDLLMRFGSFGQIDRKATGGMVTGNFEKGNFQASFSRPKGKFQRLFFPGEDGVQGPYRLLGPESNITIVPASEVVYLDGEKMTRGWNEDYTIDYSTAEITFTNKRIISANSRIEVNYEYSFDAYERNALGVGGNYKLSLLNFGIYGFNESDNQNQSFAYNLSNADIESLAIIGDDTSQAWLDGGKFAGTNQGDYRKEVDRYVYAGRNQGDYTVAFTLVGDSLGDYIYDDSIYVYAGNNQGQYVAKRHILLPGKNEIYLTDFGLKTEYGLNFGIEASMSHSDQNLFSVIDDDNNRGFAYAANASFQKPGYGFGFKRKMTPTNFANPMQSQEVDFSYNWGDVPEEERKSSDEIQGFIKPFHFLTIDGGTGWLNTHNNETRTRFNINTKLFWAGYGISQVQDILRQDLNLNPHISFLYPKLFVFKEDRPKSRRLTLNPSLGLKPYENWNATVSYDQTQEEKKDTMVAEWQKQNIKRIYKLDLNAKPLTNLDFQGIFGVQSKSYQEVPGTDWNQYFADLAGSYSLVKGFNLRIEHHRSNQQTQAKQERYIKVDSGFGDYKRDPETGNYYPDPNGDYERILEPTGAVSRSQEQDWQGNFDFSFFEPINLNFLMSLNQEQTDTSVIFRVYDHDARLGVFPIAQNPGYSIYFDHEYNYALDYRYTGQKSWQNRNGIEINTAPATDFNLKSRFELNLNQKQRTIPVLFNRSNQLFVDKTRLEDLERKISLEPFIGYGLDIELTLGQAWRNISYTNYNDFQLLVTNLGIRRRWQFRKNLALTIETSIIRRRADIEKVPFEISLNDPLGITPEFNISFDQMVSKELVLSINYRFVNRPDRTPEQNLAANLRAYF